MKSIIEEIYDSMDNGIGVSEKYFAAMSDFCSLYDNFIAGLDEKQEETLRMLSDLNAQMEWECSHSSFSEGFKRGVMLVLEVFYRQL